MDILNHTPYRLGWITGKLAPPAHALTFVVKGTFALVPGGAAVPLAAEEQAFFDGDRPHDDDPGASLCYESDFALFKPRADVLLTGTCHTPGGRPLPVCRVAFGVGRMVKELAVIGDRRWVETPVSGLEPSEPSPFRSMPLRYELAFGGPGFASNPVGKGFGEAARSLPNIEYPHRLIRAPRDVVEPAGFGPLDRRWADRASKLGTYDRRWLEERWPHFPADFDHAYFNAAPRDQQLGYLRGDEPLVFDNLHPEHARYASSLPGLRMRGFLRCAGRSGSTIREVPLQLDTLWVDMDAERLVLTWRGVTPVESHDHAEIEEVLLVSEDLAEPARPLAHYQDERAWMRPGEDAREAAARDEAEARAEADAPTDADADGEVDAAEGEEDGEADAAMEKALADARAALQQAGVRASTLDRVFASDSADDAMSLLVADLGLDPDAAEAALREANAKTKELLAAQGVDPSVLDTLDGDDDETVVTTAGKPMSRETLEQRARAGEPCAGADLSGLDLGGMDLSGADLHEASLEGANLARARLDGADLRGARLGHANLEGASLVGAVLDEATLRGANATSADLSRAHLAKAALDGAVLFGARLDGADLAGATLTQSDLRTASLADADLEKANLGGAVLRDASGARARFEGATIAEADFTGASFDGASFTGAAMDHARFERASLRGAFFQRAAGLHVTMADADLTKARAGEGCALPGADLRRIQGEGSFWGHGHYEGANFGGSALSEAEFAGASLEKVDFHRAVLKRANLASAKLRSARLTKVDMFRGRLDRADLTDADCEGSSFFECDFLETITTRTRFGSSNLGRTIFAARARAR